jgi:hypothetical protein
MGGLTTACKGEGEGLGQGEELGRGEEQAQEDMERAVGTDPHPARPATGVDSIGDGIVGVVPLADRGNAERSDAGPEARLNVIFMADRWSGIDDLALREATLLRQIQELVTRVGGDTIPLIAVEVSPVIGAVRLTLPDSLIALSLASRLRATGAVASADLDRQEVRRHP